MRAQLLRLPVPHIIRLQHLDGREWVQESFTDVRYAWGWVAHMVAEQVGCEPGAVDAFEGPEGTWATVDGLPVCWIVHGLSEPQRDGNGGFRLH